MSLLMMVAEIMSLDPGDIASVERQVDDSGRVIRLIVVMKPNLSNVEVVVRHAQG